MAYRLSVMLRQDGQQRREVFAQGYQPISEHFLFGGRFHICETQLRYSQPHEPRRISSPFNRTGPWTIPASSMA